MSHLNLVVPFTVSFKPGGSSFCVIYIWWFQFLFHLNLVVPISVSFKPGGSSYCVIYT